MTTINDLTGQQFSRWEVMKLLPDRQYGKAIWECKCVCGNIRFIPGSNLTTGISKSCGCYNLDRLSERSTKYITRAEAAINDYYHKYRRNAEVRNLCFDLTFNEFVEIVKKPCFYCGIRTNIVKVQAVRRSESNQRFVGLRANGIDRLDSFSGYTLDNCVPCCSVDNLAKQQLTAQQYIEHCKGVAIFHSDI